MAVQDCDKISNIVAINLLAGDDELSSEIAELARQKNSYLIQARKLKEGEVNILGQSAHELELKGKSAEIKINAIVQSYILEGQAGNEAYMELARQISKTKLSLASGTRLLDMVRNAPVKDYESIAKLWDSTLNMSDAIKDMNDSIAKFVSNDYSIYRANYIIEDYQANLSAKIGGNREMIDDAEDKIKEAKELLNNKNLTKTEKEKYNKIIEEQNKIIDEKEKEIKGWSEEKKNMNKIVEEDYKKAIDEIKKGGNPKGRAKLDEEWTAIKKLYGDEPEKAGDAWTNYIMARELIAGGDMANSVITVLKNKSKNLSGKLTGERIDKCKSLDLLLARAFTNTRDLCYNGNLRAIYREKLIKLSAGERLTDENIAKVNSLINSIQYASDGMMLSDVMIDNRAYRSMRDMGYKVSEKDGGTIVDGVKRLSRKVDEDQNWIVKNMKNVEKEVGGTKIKVDVVEVGGQEMEIQDIVKLIYDITGDRSIAVLNDAGRFSDKAILGVATQKLLGNNDKAKALIEQLFDIGKEGAKIKNARGISLMAITGTYVPDGAKVGFFDYKKGLYFKDDVSGPRAKMLDSIANKNRMRLENTDFVDLTTDVAYSKKNVEALRDKLKEQLGGGKGFLIVSDGRRGDNQLLRDAINGLEDKDNIKVLYPGLGEDASMSVENGSLYFKTIHNDVFDDIAGTISIQSMGNVKPTREMIASAAESSTSRNQDKLRYQAMFSDGAVDNLGNALSDQQIEYFAKSAIRDENGNLIKVYHGTNAIFDVFDIEASRKSADIQGLYFSSNIDEARGYGDNVGEFYLNIVNPADYDTAYRVFDKYKQITNGGVVARQELIDMGYDGIIKGDGEYVAFYSNQIKTAENQLPTYDDRIMFDMGYHGSKVKINKFDLEFAGSANGKEQGFGIYLTKDWEFAHGYASKGNPGERSIIYGSWPWSRTIWPTDKEQRAANMLADRIQKYGDTPEKAIAYIKKQYGKDKDITEFIDGLSPSKFRVFEGGRYIYTVKFPDNIGANYIEWGEKFGKERFEEIKTQLNDYIDNTFGRDNIRRSGEDLPIWNAEDPIGEDVYHLAQSVLGTDEEASKFFDSIGFDGNHYVDGTKNNYVIFNTDKLDITDNYSRQLETEAYMKNLDTTADAAKKLELFNKSARSDGIRTMEDLANKYGLPIKLLKELDMPKGVKARGAYQNEIIYLADVVNKNTLPHEIFHGAFSMWNPEGKKKFIEEGVKLFGTKEEVRQGIRLSAEDVFEEMLAEEFGHWARTGEFTTEFAERLGRTEGVGGAKKYWADKVKDMFKDFMEWLGLMRDYSNEVNNLFRDIINCKYLADDGKPINGAKSLVKYNDTLNDAAMNYFGKMLGFSTDVIDEEYVKRVQTTLSDMLGMDINTFDLYPDKADLYLKIDKQLTLEKLTTGRYRKEVADIRQIRDGIKNLSDEDLAADIEKEFGDLVKGGTIVGNENISLIREAWYNYNIAEDMPHLLGAEGSIISLVRGIDEPKLNMTQLQNVVRNKKDAAKIYKDMFFPDQEISNEDLTMFIKQINGDIFDGLSIQFTENLVDAGYSLPLVNTKQVVYDYLAGKLDLNSDFCQAFFYKNNIAPTRDNLNTLMDTMMPKEFKFNFKTFEGKLLDDSVSGNVFRIVKDGNIFMPDSYSALATLDDFGRGATLGNKEYKVLKSTIDKYVDEMKKGLRNKDFKFLDAQKLKQDFGYAMDTFEQDIIIPKYGKFLTPQERRSLMGVKYTAPIGVSEQKNIKAAEEMIDNWRNRILGRDEKLDNGSVVHHRGEFEDILGTMYKNNGITENDINMYVARGFDGKSIDDDKIRKQVEDRIKRRRDQLIKQGATIKEINGEYVVYDIKESLWETVNNLPGSIQGVGSIASLGRQGIENLTNEQAYKLLRYLEAAKALATTSNYPTQLMYKQMPQLAQYSFFKTYAIEEGDSLPKVMKGNSLSTDNFFSVIDNVSNTIDQEIKEDIFGKVKGYFKAGGDGFITAHSSRGRVGLDKIIEDAVDRQIYELGRLDIMSTADKEIAKQKMINTYTNMFIPYTYLRDIPVGGTMQIGEDTVTLLNVKDRVRETIKQAYDKAIEDLSAVGATDGDPIQKMITITLDDGSTHSIGDLGQGNIDDWKKSIFDDEDAFVKSADDVEVGTTRVPLEGDTNFDLREKEKIKATRENIENQYMATLKTIQNHGQVITDAERDMMVSFMHDVRTDLRKYSLTNKMVDALDATSGMGEEVARGLKSYVIGLGGMRQFGTSFQKRIWQRYGLVRDAYRGYYAMSMEQLGKINLSTLTPAERVAWDTARYFKNLERLLGSVDGVTGVTTRADINRAFYHIGEVFMNLGREGAGETGGIRGIFGMLSGIEQNQILKFFKFSLPGQPSYVKQFVVKTDRMKALDWAGGYRDYVNDISGITQSEFNEIFGTQFGDKQFKRVLQGLTGFTFGGGGFFRVINQILDIANQSWMAFRFAMSYPGQLLTIPQQGVSYFLKQIGFEKSLGIEDLASVDAIRESFGILDGAYNELNITQKLNFNPDSLDQSSFYNRYGIPSSKDLYDETGITTADDYINMYAKVDKKYAKPGKIQRAIKWFDPYKDNANNFIDGIFARNFKNVAFVKGLKDNSYMKFSSAEDFLDFMNDATISNDIKSKLVDAVAASAGRNFRSILGLGFGGLDRPVAGRGWANCLYGLMQMFNFRGSWGQNIFKQTGENIYRFFRFGGGAINPRLSREAKEQLVQYLGNTPEFTNFVTAMIQDLKRAFKLQRYQDNGRRPDPETDGWHYFLDYLSYIRETMNMVSQRYQGIQSFGPMRPISEMAGSSLQSHMDPAIYQDTWGVGAFFNALGKNFGRQRKPVNRLVEMIGAYEAGEEENLEAYIDKQLFNLSFGSLRYMVNEDENAYGYTYEVTGQYGGIPGVVMGEAQIGSDKSFMYDLDNTETRKTMQIIADDDVAWTDKKSYVKNLWKGIVNGSQLFKTIKNANLVRKGEYDKVFFNRDDLYDTITVTDAGKEIYDKGYYIPKTPAEADTFIKTILANGEYRPGSPSFYKSILQFEDFGHMAGKNGKEADADMELWLEHMKYKTDEHGQFVKKNGERIIEDGWKDLITNIKEYGYDKDYTTKTIYNYSLAWLDIHNSDPNYPLYLSMLGQGRATMLIDEEMTKRKEKENKGKKGKDNKWDENENAAANLRDTYLRLGNSKREGSNITFFEELNRLDEDDATLATLKIIRDQARALGKKDIEKFFDITTDEKDGEVVENVTLKPQYESILKQIGRIGRAIDEGNADRVIATTSLLTQQFKNADPTGEVTASMINSIYNRVYSAKNLTPSLKNEIMIGVFYDNIDMVQRKPEELRELMGDAYDEYARGMNDMLHKRDSQIISNIDSIITSGDNDSSGVKSGRAASKALKNYAAKLAGVSGDGIGTTYRKGQRAGVGDAKWIPVKIQGADLVKQLGLKGYNPTNVNEVVFKHTPTVDFSIQKDVRRKIKTKSTQTVSTKKQLSNIETKTTKALEAES